MLVVQPLQTEKLRNTEQPTPNKEAELANSNRLQQFSVHGSLNDSTACNCGVPQGSVLGPLLFCLYLCSVPGIFKSGGLSPLYANDITFYTSSKSVDELCQILSSDLRNLNEYLCKCSLLLNPQKTQFLVVCKLRQAIPCTTSIRLNMISIPTVCQAKYLDLSSTATSPSRLMSTVCVSPLTRKLEHTEEDGSI